VTLALLPFLEVHAFRVAFLFVTGFSKESFGNGHMDQLAVFTFEHEVISFHTELAGNLYFSLPNMPNVISIDTRIFVAFFQSELLRLLSQFK
jgi:hypothetical protein